MTWYRQGSWLAAVVLGLVLVAACSSSSRRTPPAAVAGAAGGIAAPGEQVVADVAAGYKLGAGDRVRLTVFRHEDLSGEFEIDGEGGVAMPLVGEIPAMGLTARQLEQKIEEQLTAQGYLVDPQVSIEVLNYRPFYILGEVNNPGSYPYVNGMSVITAVALAGGFSYRADQDDITITRGGSNGATTDADSVTQVLPGDIITVPERFF